MDEEGEFGVLPIIAAIGTIMIIDYAIEIYKSIREGEPFLEGYKKGAERTGRELGMAFRQEKGFAEFAAGVVFKRISTGILIIKGVGEIVSHERDISMEISAKQEYTKPDTSAREVISEKDVIAKQETHENWFDEVLNTIKGWFKND